MSVELRHQAKFRGVRSDRCRDIAVFRFFKIATATILDFKNFKFLTVGTVQKVELRSCAKFRRHSSNRGRYRTKPIQALVDTETDLTSGSQPCERASLENSLYRTLSS